MAAIILPHRWTKPPQVAVEVDFAHPLSKGIVDVFMPHQPIALVSRVPGAASNAFYSVSASHAGRGMRLTDASTRISYSNNLARRPAPLAIALVHTLATAPASSLRTFGNLGTFAYGYGFAPNGTNFRGIFSNGGNVILTGDGIAAGYQCEMLTLDASSNGRLYRGGRLTAGPTSAPMTTATGNIAFGLESGGGASGVANDLYHMGVVWARAPSDAEARAFAQNPYQILRPVRRRIWSLPVTATFNPAWARNANTIMGGL